MTITQVTHPPRRRSSGTKYETKSTPAFVLKADNEPGVVEAIVSVMGILDLGNDIIHNGAYVKTITERAGKIRVLNMHRTFSVLDVIGRPLEIREVGRKELPDMVLDQFPDATGGLYTKTQYALDLPEGEGVYKRIKVGLIDEYSIGYEALDEDYERRVVDGDSVTIRNIRTIRLWEYSPVIWGMNPATTTLSKQAFKEMTPDGPKRRLGDHLVACIRQETMMYVEGLLKEGFLNQQERNGVASAIDKCIDMLNTALPETLSLIEVAPSYYMDWLYLFSDDPQAAAKALVRKAGRTLSQRNATRIEQAAGLLNDVLSDAGWNQGDSTDDDLKSGTEPVESPSVKIAVQAGPSETPTSQGQNSHPLLVEVEAMLRQLETQTRR